MNRHWILLIVLLACAARSTDATESIDRLALVTRHNISWDDPLGQIPLGNGEFCFNADGTGLQTFGGNTMSHWGWHSFPLPEGVSEEHIPPTGTFQQGRNTGPDVFPEEAEAIRRWMIDNPHRLNLGRIRLAKSGGAALSPEDVQGLSRSFDLWSGLHTSRFSINGQAVEVITCVHPNVDMVAVQIESPLLERGELEVVVDFPYASTQRRRPWVGDFERATGHETSLHPHPRPERRADIRRFIDDMTYHASITWSEGGELEPLAVESTHGLRVVANGSSSLAFSCVFSAEPIGSSIHDFATTSKASSEKWRRFWMTGGAVDLSGSTDPRWKELERRIVLSQYHMAAQSAGSHPPAEAGLMDIDPWRGQFHMEMTWWHLAHYALWNRWEMTEPALSCYQRFIPDARALAGQLGYKGLKWQKCVGPEGRTAPWIGNQVLLWKQPHPIFFAELEYRLRPTRATLDKWSSVLEGTAEHMADYPAYDHETGIYHLDPVMPPSELGITRDTVFDLAYWRWGLDRAQVWRERMGLDRKPKWDAVRRHLAPLPVHEGLYVHSAEWLDTYTARAWEHPDPIGVFGMLPATEGLDLEIAHRTVLEVWETWDWARRCWGWDFPWMAMAAARVGEPGLAVDALLKDAGTRNHYDERGVCTGGPCPYLPGNGGLLYAVAMMAAGWDGAPETHAPGFPNDGSWTVRWEGLKRAP